MQKIKNPERFLGLIELNSIGLEKVKVLYEEKKYDEAVYEYYLFAKEKFAALTDTLKKDVTQQDILDAENIMENKIRMIGYDYTYAGTPIDWCFYPENDKQWQNHLCYMYFPKALLCAYRKTGDLKYVKKWNSIHLDFVKNHPYGNQNLFYSKRMPMYKNEYLPVCGGEGFCRDYIGGSWISLAASRVECWIEGMTFLAQHDLLDPEVLCSLTESVVSEHLPVLFDNPRKGTPNQFVHISNILISIGIAFWETKSAPAAYLVGMERLEQSVGKFCVLPDGTDLEQCTAYNSGLVSIFYEIYQKKELKENKRIQKLWGKILKRCEYLALVKDPLGYTPAMSKRQNKAWDNKCEDIKQYADMYRESELLRRICNFFEYGKADAALPQSVDFPYGGYSVLRDGWGKDSRYLFMKYSRYAPGHKHEDTNSVVLTALGRRLLIDSGNYNYSNDAESAKINNYMHSSRAHNTMDIDGLSQARRFCEQGRKLDERYPDKACNEKEYEKYEEIVKLHSEECPGRRIHKKTFEMIEGIYEDGYYNPEGNDGFIPGKHVRRTIFVRGVGYIIDDIVTVPDNEEHTFCQHWNLAEDFTAKDVILQENSVVTCTDGVNLGIWNFSDSALSYKMYYKSTEPVAGWVAVEYGHMVPGVDISVFAKTKKRCRMISFIYPFEKDACKVFGGGLCFSAETEGGKIEFEADGDGGIIKFGQEKFEY